MDVRDEAGSRWRDELVDLHVLAENGDSEAAERARRWLERDADARRAWDEVERTCGQVKAREDIER